MDMIQGGNRMVFVLKAQWEISPKFIFQFLLEGKFLFFNIGNNSPLHCGRVEEGKSVRSGAF